MTIIALALLLQQTHGPALPTGDALTKQAYVLSSAKAVPTPKVIVDTSAAPDLAEWGKISATLMEQWYPIVWNLLGTDQSKPADTIKAVPYTLLTLPTSQKADPLPVITPIKQINKSFLD